MLLVTYAMSGERRRIASTNQHPINTCGHCVCVCWEGGLKWSRWNSYDEVLLSFLRDEDASVPVWLDVHLLGGGTCAVESARRRCREERG